jgi:MoaA/NifB/PqqE/SkfB family radical SAM enzyme
MSFATFVKAARNLGNRLQITVNARRGREYIPRRSGFLNIETSSTCNLKCRFCAYIKKQGPKVSMPNELFFDCVEQATELGFDTFDLTPCTGDVFMDPELDSKLEFLDDHPGVRSFQFFTNFTIPSPTDIDRLVRYRKLRVMAVSLYGHDPDSFVAITQSKEKVYRRLVVNLERLLELLDRRHFELQIHFRSTRDVPRGEPSDVLRLLARFRNAGIVVRTSRVYNNWGGYITKDDVRGLGIDITGTESTFKKGACTLLFTHVQVTASGIVNGCACRDVDATLRIGDLNKESLATILSTENPTFLQLVREQQRGDFRPVCRSCDYYKSVYRRRWMNGNDSGALLTLKDYLDDPAARSRVRTEDPS